MYKIEEQFNLENNITLFHGDCFDLIKQIPDHSVDIVITSPPYAMGKSYERPKDDLDTFIEKHEQLFPEINRVLKPGGSICWQVGYHVKNGVVTPLDFLIYDIISRVNLNLKIEDKFILRNRIVWTFGHGLNNTNRFSGRHETLLWFSKGNGFDFDLDAIRVPQKYPGKTHYKGEKKGELSGNPLGKNPSDVWDIPNVKANHIEKTEHPCQFPVVIPQRLIRALTPDGGVVLDPYNGSGTTGVAAIIENRKYIGAELHDEYIEISKKRLQMAIDGDPQVREDKPIFEPSENMKVAKKPDHFA